jgi:glycosyltransferase involved in cell wall biosynthesis
MKVIALVPVRNEAWILPHALACFSGFCDHVIVSDQASTDGSRALCAEFPKVVLIDRAPTTDRAMAASRRWQLLDAARGYAGHNLLFSIDADELISPAMVRAWLQLSSTRLEPRTFFRCGYYQLWNAAATYRDDDSPYQPQLKLMAFVDDRRVDFERLPAAALLHEPRVPEVENALTSEEPELPVLHLQWLLPEYNQVKQAWYRCRELVDGRQTAAELNEFYAITLPSPQAHTAPVPQAWLEGITFPDFAAVDRQPAWHAVEILRWFDRFGIEFFEPLEIWHIAALRQEFQRRVGREPHPDRSYVARWHHRAHRVARRAAGAAWRRMFT